MPYDATEDDPLMVSRPSSSSESQPPGSFTRAQFAAFFVMGTINNLPYVVVGSAAKSLADSFNEADLIGVIQWATVAVGLFVRALNAFYLEGTSFSTRVAANTAAMVVGLVAVAMSVYIDFSFAIGAIVVIGGASSFGESVILSYLKGFDSELTGAWSSGTGMAGVGGSLSYILLGSAAGLSNETVFLLLIPTAVAYWMAFLVAARSLSADNAPDEYSPMAAEPQPQEQLPPHKGEPGLARVLRVTRQVLGLATQLMLVYFFEYCVSVGFAALANIKPAKGRGGFFRRHSYAILAFCYQLGVFVSRSSISVLKIRRFWVLTTLQAANFAIWLVHSTNPFLPLWLQFALMVYVGLLGGAMYVNVFYFLVRDPAIADADKELAINVTAIFINFGIVAASAFEIASDKTFLAGRVDETN